MSNLTTLKILISTIFGVIIFIKTSGAEIETAPIALVEVVHQEVEIEYVHPDVWSQWVFDTDNGIEYINLDE